MKFYVGVHSSPDGPAGLAIRAATELYCKPPWILGPANPATHAFLLWEHADWVVYRLDGQPGGAALSVYPAGWQFTIPTALWRLTGDVDQKSMLDKVVHLVGQEYGYFEVLAQGLPLPIGLKAIDFVKQSSLCTRVVQLAMEAAGGAAAHAATSLPDLFPERFGRMCQSATEANEGWISRVM